MKIKKLISSALVFVMLFTTMVSVFPVFSSAEEAGFTHSVKEIEEVESEFIQKVISDYRLYGASFTNKDGESVSAFTSARDALDYELRKEYLDSVKYGNTVVYVNRYTGFMYYENTVTGQVITSNPFDPAYNTKEGGEYVKLGDEMLSQLQLQYFEAANTSNTGNYNSLYWIDQNGLAPTVTATDNGLAVEYILGSAMDSFIAPGAMIYTSAVEVVIKPMFENYAALLEEQCGEFNEAYAPLNSSGEKISSYNGVDILIGDSEKFGVYQKSAFLSAVDTIALYSKNYDSANGASTYTKISAFASQLKNFFNRYRIVDPEMFGDNIQMADAITAFAEGQVIMVLNGAESGDSTLTDVRIVDKAIRTTCRGFTMDDVSFYEEECGFVAGNIDVPYFKVTMIYSIDDNGDLLVSIPANLIEYNREFISLNTISPLKYFGLGDMDNDGYLFFPDGSGAIVEFDDFYFGSTSDKTSVAISPGEGITMYGSDYCYAKVTGQHREQLIMPVYGLVNEVKSTGEGLSKEFSRVTNGYFAVIEKGSALSSLTYLSGGGTHKYIALYSTFTPFPTDTYDLSQSISVSGLGSYTIATEAKYTDSITTRYTMLVDHDVYAEAVIQDPTFVGYLADYIGMATCYRTYLEKNGVIKRIADSDILSDLPLYIEALGSIDITKKILSFPVTVSEALTSFEDVEKMYKEFADAIETLNKKAAAYDAAADEIEAGEYPELRQNEIDQNRANAEKYRELATKIDNIKNVNFKLTGFANGGMHSTYPTKLKWESSVGGKRGFETLLSNAKTASEAEDSNFGVYPDFDFMYINNTASFDGIGRRGNASCMVDNRYASKQEYNSVKQAFETMFALVISSSSLDSLYSKFDKKYSAYGASGLSVSTLTSDLNSNFDKKNPVVREESLNNVRALLQRMSESYSLMGEKGNFYTVEYLDHILKAPIDSSHYNVISYTVPFYGMVLHGYVNYAGSPINYSGSPEYEILRSIENGASLYYILCMENTNYLKNDPELSDYFGVDYNNWFEKIVVHYKTVNDALADLQTYQIVGHTKVLAERIIDAEEMDDNYRVLIEEFKDVVSEEISHSIDMAIKAMRENGTEGGLKFVVSENDFSAILAVLADRVNLSVDTLCEKFGLDDIIQSVIDEYSAQYSSGVNEATITADDVDDYRSKYAYITDSTMSDEDYVTTDFTCDNGNVVMVTYEKEVDGKKDTVIFLLNYNEFSVKIKLDGIAYEKLADICDEDGFITVDKYGFIKG